MGKALSIRTKIHLILGVIFLFVLVIVVSVSVNSEKNLAHEMAVEKLQEKASSYLDTLNMLMISGAINNRELVREKLLSDNNIVSAKIIRHESINKMYGPGLPHEHPVDEIDERSLKGEEILFETNDENGHIMTYVMPVLAYADYRGTDCIACHQAKENDVLGAIRISYSLDEMNGRIFNNMLKMSMIQVALFAGALVLLAILFRRLVVSPVKSMHKTLDIMEKNSDLTQSAEVISQDEIGSAAMALNAMIKRFASSLQQVVALAEQLNNSAQQIEASSQASLQAAQSQSSETTEIHHALQELHESTQLVMANAQESSQASQEAKVIANEGMTKTDLASQSINTMNLALVSAADVIGALDERSNNVGGVLDVIKGVAEQTNLLALNAAIEAARAGESGRGFAVVADEVRTLSQRTAESTQEIEKMIAQLQAEARKAVGSMQNAQSTASEGIERVQEAASALYSMTGHVERMNQLNEETLRRMANQVAVGDSVNQRVERINEHSQNSADTARQTTEVSESLVKLAQDLSQLVGNFKL